MCCSCFQRKTGLTDEWQRSGLSTRQNLLSPRLFARYATLCGCCSIIPPGVAGRNPRVQQTVLAAGLLPQLLRLVALDGSVRVRLRCLYALSCLVRQMPEAQDSLLHHGGLTVLAGLFTAPAASLKLQLKAVTLLHDLVIEEVRAPLGSVHCQGLCKPCFFFLTGLRLS